MDDDEMSSWNPFPLGKKWVLTDAGGSFKRILNGICSEEIKQSILL